MWSNSVKFFAYFKETQETKLMTYMIYMLLWQMTNIFMVTYIFEEILYVIITKLEYYLEYSMLSSAL